jgi:ubiquinone/menaquinone biosynthesis C-methylase UbiE
VSRWAIVEAKRRHPNVTFLRADAGALPFQAAAFNVVTLLETLEHCEEPHRILEEVRRLLAPAGVAIISVPTTDLNDTRADKTHRWHLAMEAWRDMFAKELRVVEVKYFLKRLRYFDRRVANTFFVLTV